MNLKASRRVVIEISKADLVGYLKTAYPMDVHIQTLRADTSVQLELMGTPNAGGTPNVNQSIRLTSNSAPKDIQPNDSIPYTGHDFAV